MVEDIHVFPKVPEKIPPQFYGDEVVHLDDYSYLGMGSIVERSEILDFLASINLEVPSLPINGYEDIEPIVDAYFQCWQASGSDEFVWIKAKMLFVVLFDSLKDTAAKELIDSINMETIQDLNKVYLLEEITRVFQVHQPKKIEVVKSLVFKKTGIESKEDNYFMSLLLKRIKCKHIDMPGFVELDEDKESVFEISQGIFATVDFETASLIISGDESINDYFAQDPENLKFNSFMVWHDEKSQDISSLYPEVDNSLILDYIKMCQANSRNSIESAFQISLIDLTIKEQVYFIYYLKSISVAQAETMQLFIQNYGIDAMRAFLVNQYDENASENIMAFGLVIEPDVAKDVFAAYAQSIDSATQFGTNFKESGAPVETAQMIQEVQKSLLKRAGHLFDAGKQMALWEYSGTEEIPDLIEAFNGVAKMQDILARIGHDEKLSVTRNNAREGGKNLSADTGSEAFFFGVQDIAKSEKLALKVFIRPQANADGEARINFELILNDMSTDSPLKKAFAQEIEYKTSKKTRKDSVIRFGFDLDTKHNPPKFSFDMGRNTFEDATMKRTGDVLGNILNQVAVEGHHLTEFDSKFSDPEVFRKIAESVKVYFSSLAQASVMT